MGRIIRDFWVLTIEGIVLFERTYNPEIKSQLLGALLSALNTIAESLTDKGLSNFEIVDSRYSIMKREKWRCRRGGVCG